MTFWTLDRVADALGGSARVAGGGLPRGTQALRGVSTDTRAIVEGDLFVALRGERFDAHDFLPQAVASGARAIVVSDAARAAHLGVPVYAVADTTAALGALGRYRRRVWGAGKVVVAIAGSNGKTSTKELVAAVLGSRLAVHATRGNLNNHVGVPLTLLALPDAADVAVVEVGTNHPGEIAMLRAIAEPDVAVITSIGEEHLEGFGDLEGVLREEASIADGVGLAIVPTAQPEIAAATRPLARRVATAGLEAGDVRPDRWGIDEQGLGWLAFGEQTVRVPLRGAHNLRNAMLAVAVGRELGLDMDAVARGLAATPAVPMRMAWESLGSLTLVNDAYNANPASAREAIRLLEAVGARRQRVLVLGTMLELGPTSPALHDEIAALALASPADVVAGIGDFARALAAVAGQPVGRVITAPDVPDLWPKLAARLSPDALVMLKGSRGMRLERLVPLLAEHAGVPSVERKAVEAH
jgi:UDP-N-acetylmuramoyl-tripeptide--D-alanyl-D-alanine ligase